MERSSTGLKTRERRKVSFGLVVDRGGVNRRHGAAGCGLGER